MVDGGWIRKKQGDILGRGQLANKKNLTQIFNDAMMFGFPYNDF